MFNYFIWVILMLQQTKWKLNHYLYIDCMNVYVYIYIFMCVWFYIHICVLVFVLIIIILLNILFFNILNFY